MPNFISIGKRKNDFGLAIDFHNKRAIVRANTSWIAGGIPLEEIPVGANSYAPAMVLISRYWRSIYFVEEKIGWNEEEYFQHAEKLMKKRGITKP